MSSLVETCPKCGTVVPVHHGFVTWCHECSWNLVAPQRRDQPTSRVDRLYARAGRGLGDRLVRELLTAPQLEPRLTATRIVAYVLAALVFAAALASLATGVLLAVLAFPNPAALLGAAILIGFAVLMRPRLGTTPDEGVVDRSRAPSLFALVDEIASALAVPPVDVVVVDSKFNASWQVVGIRRRGVLTIGLPLLTMLEPQERVALIAHELAHGRNGDSTRGLVVGSAARALAEVYGATAPEDLDGAREWGELAIFERIVNGVMWLLSLPPLALFLVQAHLLLRDSQRAEFLADALAADVAGTEAVVTLHEKLLLESTFWFGVQRAARDQTGRSDLFEILRELVATIPERERERRRRIARLDDARLDETHPPTAHRIRLLQERARVVGRVVLDTDQAAAIDSELHRLRLALQSELVDSYRDTLYAR